METRTRTRTRGIACALDVETGGVEDHHPTTQIAVVAFDEETFREGESLEIKLLFDEAACDPEALKLNSYDALQWSMLGVDTATARRKLDAFFTRHATWQLISKGGRAYTSAKLVAHNAEFDIARLRKLWGDQYAPFAWWYALDTIQLALWKLSASIDPPRNYQLGTLCEYFGIETAGAHDALADCKMTIKLTQALMELEPRRV